MKKRFSLFSAELTDDIRNKRSFSIVTYSVLGVVALFMTVMNVFTDKGFLTVCTAIFAGLCLVNIVLTFFGDVLSSVAKVMFAIEVLFMFTFFLVSGNPEGFSAIWICMLPSLGMFFFDRWKGTGLCCAMFLILAFFLWTPLGNTFLMYDYTDSFKMRFPVLFVAFHLLAFLLETLRMNAYTEMKRLQAHYQHLSVRDQLTDMFNRQGMYSELESKQEYSAAKELCVAMFDIDYFKSVNDTYGHNVGDAVLKECASIINDRLDGVVCRWGGEEFVVIACSDRMKVVDLENVVTSVAAHQFSVEDHQFSVSISAGYCTMPGAELNRVDTYIGYADAALYHAKNGGRNQICAYTASMTPSQEATL